MYIVVATKTWGIRNGRRVRFILSKCNATPYNVVNKPEAIHCQ